ncbi:MAG: LamG-like jellyroll fold domain-containing protein [Bythopirellula sp.]
MQQTAHLYRRLLLCCISSVILLEAVCAAPDSSAPIPTPNPEVVGQWLLDETEGPTGEENWGIYDQSGHGNHGYRDPLGTLAERPTYSTDTPNPTPPDPTSWNHSLDFSLGSKARVEIPDSGSLDLTGDFTVETWINFSSLSGDQWFAGKRNIGGPESCYWLEWDTSDAQVNFFVGTSAGYERARSQSFTPNTGQWYHIAGVHDATAGEVRLYIDGQLNNTSPAQSTVLTNNAPLYFGAWTGNQLPANAKLDDVRISNRVVPPEALTLHNSHGPARVIFGDSYETYAPLGDWFARAGGARNHWRTIEETSAVSIDPTAAHSHSPGHSLLLQHTDADRSTDHEGSLYYNLPVAATRGAPIVGMTGWVSFANIDNVRLFWDQQVWTGGETHYDVTQTLLIGGMTYFGNTKTWSVDPDYPIEYSESLDDWHYYNLVIDYEKKEYVAFQFDNDVWDMRGQAISVLPGFFDPSLLPTIDHNIRLLELASADRPADPWSAQFAQDDPQLIVYHPGDFDNDGDVDELDFEVMKLHWLQSVPIGTLGDVNFDGKVDLQDFRAFKHDLFEGVPKNIRIPASKVPEPVSHPLGGTALVLIISGRNQIARNR